MIVMTDEYKLLYLSGIYNYKDKTVNW
jgi:hypothetical protein